MKIFTGIVTSTKTAKTAKVAVTRVVPHPVYGKRMKRTKNYLVHDEVGAQVGDKVQFVACKPFSKRKKWIIVAPKNTAAKKSKTVKNSGRSKRK